MEYAYNNDKIDFYNLECELERIKSLFWVVCSNYFCYSQDFAESNAALMATQYTRYSDLAFIGVGLITDVLKTVSKATGSAENNL